MPCRHERELPIPLEEELLAPKEEPEEVVEQLQVEEQRVETSTQANPSREGRKRVSEAHRLVQDARENVGTHSNLCKHRRSLNQYTG